MDQGDYILEAQGLGRTFQGFHAVRNVDLRVRRHAVHALIGPNGAGKTTCFNLLSTFLPATSGRIVFDGQDITRKSPAQVAALGLVRSFQISAVFAHLTVLENVRLGLLRQRTSSLAFWRSERTLERFNNEAEALAVRVGLKAWLSHKAGDLSYGRKRALELATTIALNPRLILLDEPMAGLGQEDIEPVMQLIAEVAQGRTILMVEHNMSVVARLCDRITVLQAGEVLAEGSYDAVSNDPRVIDAYVGGVDD